MTLALLPALLVGCGLAISGEVGFESPVRLEADGAPVRVESPGYAAPCWADIDGDGDKDLLVVEQALQRRPRGVNLGAPQPGHRRPIRACLDHRAWDEPLPG